MNVVNCWIEHPVMKLDQLFSYTTTFSHVQKGTRVLIDFNGREIVGFVDSVEVIDQDNDAYEKERGHRLKAITAIIDDTPLISDELYELALWMARDTISATISCFQAMLPSKIKPSSGNNRIKMEKWVRFIQRDEILTLKQQAAYDALEKVSTMKLSQWRDEYKSVGNRLEQLGLVEVYEIETTATLKQESIHEEAFQLNPTQQKAMEQIKQTDPKAVILLHGQTGSGKTEIYLQVAQEILDAKRQVLILVPEIALTPQMIQRVQRRFLTGLAVYHSGLNNQQKYEQYKLVRDHEVNIVVGTRSAIFMPFDNLGLIVLDEEHDLSYKQDSSPQYHCRDIALKRADTFGCRVILGSATPSTESYARAIKRVYQLVELPQRVNNNLPTCTLVSTENAMRLGQSYILTDLLIKKMEACLKRKEQILLLLNRRGYSYVMRCVSCNEVVQCPHCDIALAYHKEQSRLKCHTCGFEMPILHECPHCHHTKWQYSGVGTQKLQEEVQRCFKEAKILRMDADTTKTKNAHQNILNAFENGEADILIGTQMIAKGLDYPNVTLVGILSSDALLSRSDYRSVEMTFDMIAQAAGRSGRGDKRGEVIIQAFDPNHYAIKTASNHDYLNFFKQEMSYRHAGQYPPYAYLVSFLFTHLDLSKSRKSAYFWADKLKENQGIKVLGPSELVKIKDLNRMRIVIKGKDLIALKQISYDLMQAFISTKDSVKLSIDVNPLILD